MGSDDLLRETFAAYADRAPRSETLAPLARARAARRRARMTVATAAASVAVVAVGAVALAPRGERGTAPPVATASPGELTQRVYEGGLEFYVPASWPRDATTCNAPQQDTVVTHQSMNYCLGTEPPGLTVAYVLPLADWRGTELELRDVRRRQTTMRGHDVQHVTGVHTRSGLAVSAVVVSAMRHAVWVASPDAGLAERITATVRIVDADWQGCPPRRRRIAPAPPSRPAATERMVPAGAVSASACRYDAEGSIAQWHALDDRELVSLARLLNALPPGFADPPPAENIACERYHSDPVVVTFRYAAGPDVPVYVNFTGCTELGASNGAVHGAATDLLDDHVGRLVGAGPNAWNRWDDVRD